LLKSCGQIERCRHHLLFGFNRGFKFAEATREICAVYGEGAMLQNTARHWFSRLKDEERWNKILRQANR
ncbi:hypothetical protein AVEN_229049-2-1, partial [Araneus ventricosus]